MNDTNSSKYIQCIICYASKVIKNTPYNSLIINNVIFLS